MGEIDVVKEAANPNIGADGSSWRSCHEFDPSFTKHGVYRGAKVERVKIMPFSAAC